MPTRIIQSSHGMSFILFFGTSITASQIKNKANFLLMGIPMIFQQRATISRLFKNPLSDLLISVSPFF